MPVVKVKGGYKIHGHYKGKPKLIGTNGGQPFTSRAEAERVSAIRDRYNSAGQTEEHAMQEAYRGARPR